MSTYAKFPATPSGGVAPSNTAGVMTGLGTGSVTFLSLTYAVSNKMMDVFASVQVDVDGSGVDKVALQIPGGYQLDDSLLSPLSDVGSLVITDGNIISSRLVALPGLTNTTVNFGDILLITGGDVATGSSYLIRLRFPVK
jgi:hypothetical protein